MSKIWTGSGNGTKQDQTLLLATIDKLTHIMYNGLKQWRKIMQTCKIDGCDQKVNPLVDRDGELIYHRNKDKEKTIHLVCYPLVPDPQRLCYFHKKVAEGLIGDTHG